MPYEGVPSELTSKMDRCVKKVMKDGKSNSSAIAICKTSIMSQKEASKEEKVPDRVVEAKENVTRLVYFSQTPIQEKTLNASKEGKILKNVEIFKSGTYRNTQFKNSALDKMVANFHYLKSFGIFNHVPVRADHPSFGFLGGGGDIIDKVGGYIDDLRREGSKLVADFRITSSKMWEKISEGTYISRSAEIGTYDDNNGTVYSPVLFGVAWVDIPQVEGLSPKFSYSKDNQNIELINLNALINMNKKDNFPPEEEVVVEEPVVTEELPLKEDPIEDQPKEDDVKLEPGMQKEVVEFSKSFPVEFEELEKLRKEKVELIAKERALFVDKLELEGKIVPAQKESEVAFVKELTEEQFAKYQEMKEASPRLVKLDKEIVEGEEPEKEDEPVEKTPEEKADDFLKETK